MPLRRAYAPLQPEFDDFLFAAVGEGVNGIPLSTISMLTQLGLDPRREAAQLASLARQDAVERLVQILGRCQRTDWPGEERGRIAYGLIERLTRCAKPADAPIGPHLSYQTPAAWMNIISQAKHWMIGVILGAAILVSLIAQERWPFGEGQSTRLPPSIEAPRN